jgi:hypothetical protein
MFKRFVVILFAVALAAATVSAQQPKPASATPKADEGKAETLVAQKAPPEPPALPINIKIEVSITDQTGSGTPAKKVVTMIAGDRQVTNIRSSGSVQVKNPMNPVAVNFRNVTINVDATPMIVQKEPNKINLRLGLEYLPKSAGGQEEMEPGMATLNERLGLILESGKPMVISQAADPASDRKITVEVTATIIK